MSSTRKPPRTGQKPFLQKPRYDSVSGPDFPKLVLEPGPELFMEAIKYTWWIVMCKNYLSLLKPNWRFTFIHLGGWGTLSMGRLTITT
jgi:hypothetical protein